MLKAECPYIPLRSETEGEVDVLPASSEDVPVRLLSSGCTGYIEYPFENKLGKSCLENIASDVEKEEKIV